MNSDRVLHSLLRLLAAVLLLQSVGCAPKIYTSIQKSRPARPEGSPVLVYYISDTLPDRAEVLGRVEIRDNGMSTKCSYPEVLQLAKNEANKAGGNGLILTWHREPTEFGSSCHQIAGDMLLMPDSIYKDSYLRNTAMQAYRARYFSIPANTAVTSRPPAESGTTPCTLLVNADTASSSATPTSSKASRQSPTGFRPQCRSPMGLAERTGCRTALCRLFFIG